MARIKVPFSVPLELVEDMPCIKRLNSTEYGAYCRLMREKYINQLNPLPHQDTQLAYLARCTHVQWGRARGYVREAVAQTKDVLDRWYKQRMTIKRERQINALVAHGARQKSIAMTKREKMAGVKFSDTWGDGIQSQHTAKLSHHQVNLAKITRHSKIKSTNTLADKPSGSS